MSHDPHDPYVVPFYSSKPPHLRNYHTPAVFVAVCAGLVGVLVHWHPLWAAAYFLGALAVGVVVTELIRAARWRWRKALAVWRV